MEYNLKDKIVMITGAAGSIGEGITKEYVKEGAKVFITDIDKAKLAKIKDEIGDKCEYKEANITKYDEVKAVFEKSKAAYGDRVDILVNVAGIIGNKAIEEITEEEWDKQFAVNCKGTFFFVQQAVPMMKKNKFGKIINFSSKSGKTGSALMSHYCAAKGAIISFTQALAYELANDRINVNCICPGIVDNSGVWSNVSAGYMENLKISKEELTKNMVSKIPLKRLAKIEDIVAVTLFLSSSGADYMTGQAINVTGGREMH
jgi:NAD(P)-dependent dehydrogenase (short-subunit alcohol dehydrogenase family)